MKLDAKYTIGWVIWVAGFAVLEGLALANRQAGDTLSEHVWALLDVPVLWWIAAGAFVWLGGHFFFKRP